MKEKYRWNYDIKVKTKEGTYEYELEGLDDIDLLLMKHPGYELVHAIHKDSQKDKGKVKKLVKDKR